MRGISNGYDDVAGGSAAAARMALTAQPDGLSFFDAFRDGRVQRLARRQGDADRPALRDRRQGNRDRHRDVLPPAGLTLSALSAPPGPSRAEQLRQNVRINR